MVWWLLGVSLILGLRQVEILTHIAQVKQSMAALSCASSLHLSDLGQRGGIQYHCRVWLQSCSADHRMSGVEGTQRDHSVPPPYQSGSMQSSSGTHPARPSAQKETPQPLWAACSSGLFGKTWVWEGSTTIFLCFYCLVCGAAALR